MKMAGNSGHKQAYLNGEVIFSLSLSALGAPTRSWNAGRRTSAKSESIEVRYCQKKVITAEACRDWTHNSKFRAFWGFQSDICHITVSALKYNDWYIKQSTKEGCVSCRDRDCSYKRQSCYDIPLFLAILDFESSSEVEIDTFYVIVGAMLS